MCCPRMPGAWEHQAASVGMWLPLSSFLVSFCFPWQGNLVLMLRQQSPDDELLGLGEKEPCAVPQAFSGGQQSVSWWVAFSTPVVGSFVSDSTFIPALRMQMWNNYWVEPRAWANLLMKNCPRSPTGLLVHNWNWHASPQQPQPHHHFLPWKLASGLSLLFCAVNSSHIPSFPMFEIWGARPTGSIQLILVDHQSGLVTSLVCAFYQAPYRTEQVRARNRDRVDECSCKSEWSTFVIFV